MIGIPRLRERSSRDIVQPRLESGPLALAMAAQHSRNRAHRRWSPYTMIAPQQPAQLLRPPPRMPTTQSQDQPLDGLRRLMRAPVRPTAALPQSARAFHAVSSQPLVAGLATDLKIQTQIGHRKFAGGREN